MKRFIFGCTIIIAGCMVGCTSLLLGAINQTDASFYVVISGLIVLAGISSCAAGGYYHTKSQSSDNSDD